MILIAKMKCLFWGLCSICIWAGDVLLLTYLVLKGSGDYLMIFFAEMIVVLTFDSGDAKLYCILTS
jgi:hypothetical protein